MAGLAGTARDVAALTENGPNGYAMGGAMGGACMIGLGLALARRDRRVLVVSGYALYYTTAQLHAGAALVHEWLGVLAIIAALVHWRRIRAR